MSRRLVVCAVGLLWAVPAWAQAPAAPGGASTLGARAFGHREWQMMTAKDTFDAVTGTSTLTGLGGGVEVQQVWRSVFARVSFSRIAETGERVFVFENTVYPLGIPLEITMTPIELTAGWRFQPLGSRGIVPYLGGGALFMKYKESSTSDASGEEVSESYNGVVLFGGIEVPVWRRVSAGAELGWRKASVPDPGGTLAAFSEKDLGGVTVRVMLSIRK